MLRRVKAVLTARSTVLVILVLIVGATTVAAIVPQSGRSAMAPAAEGERGASTTGAVARALGLDRVFSTRWFAGLSLVFVASLTLSTLDQLKLARARMRQPPTDGAGGTPTSLSDEQLHAALRESGYRRLSAADGRERYVRHWQGYLGNFLLHAGMTLTVLFSVVYVLTEHRGTLHLVSGVPANLGPGQYSSRRGLFAGALPTPSEVSLYRVEPTFGVNDQLIDVASSLVFTDAEGRSRELRVAVNDFQDYRGMTVYQLVKYGHAFFLEVVGGEKTETAELMLEMPFPAKRGTASYVSESLEGGRVLKAKYYASADHGQLLSDSPQLVLRLQEGDRLLGEATLQAGQSAPLGPWTVRLARAGWWTEILFEGSKGTAGIFGGFGVLMLGAILIFFVVPREVVVRRGPDGRTIQWRTARFSEMFIEERDRVLARCTGGRVA